MTDTEKITITEWKEKYGEPGGGARLDANGRVQGFKQAYFQTEPDYCEDAAEAPVAPQTPIPTRVKREQDRIAQIIDAAPRFEPTIATIQQLRDERSRLAAKRIHQTLSNAAPEAVEQTMTELRSIELRIYEDETSLLEAA